MIRSANLTASISRRAGGLFESVRRLVQSLMEGGMEVRVLGVRDDCVDEDIAAWRPVRISAFKPVWPRQFGYSPRFLEELRSYRPDVVHTHGIWVYPGIAARAYCRMKKRPSIVSAHGMLDPWAVQNSHWKKIIARLLYEGANLAGARCLRALCESEARSIRRYGLKNEIAVIPNGIDLPNGAPQSCAPWERSIEPRKKILLFLSRIHPKKGLMNLLRAWASVQRSVVGGQRSEDWVLAIAGWDQGGHEAELKQLATHLALPWTDIRGLVVGDPVVPSRPSPISRHQSPVPAGPVIHGPWSVVFLGPQFNESKAACYHYCDAFILPSFSEGLPMVVLEAWSNAKPVIMTPQCNLPEGFIAGAALKAEPTVESLAEALSTLLTMSQGERTGIGERALMLVTQRFVWPRIAEQMKAVYEWMLGDGSKPACMADF